MITFNRFSSPKGLCSNLSWHSKPFSIFFLSSYSVPPSHLTLETQSYFLDLKLLILVHIPWFFLHYFPLSKLLYLSLSLMNLLSCKMQLNHYFTSEIFPYLHPREKWPFILLCPNVPHRFLDHSNDFTLWHILNCVFISSRPRTTLLKKPFCFITVELVFSIVLVLRCINHISIKLLN